MKVLWFTNIALPDVNRHFGDETIGTGGWLGALLELLKTQTELQLGVATASTHLPDAGLHIDGVDYFVIHQQPSRLGRALLPIDNNPIYTKKCVAVVNEYKPDLVHIHGTERFFANLMSQGLIQCPVAISIQGIMDAYCEWHHWFGKLAVPDILKISFLNSLKCSGLLWELRTARQQARRERAFFRKGKYFFGRTKWDKAYISYFNDRAHYFKINEVLRDAFWQRQWKLDSCQRHRIIFTNTRHPRKGTELLLAAVKRLKPLYPDIELILIGSLGPGGYGKFLEKKISDLGGIVKSLGQMHAKEMADELCNSHLFISASYIDNSPNSVAEAQLVGMPVISSYTGGVPSLVEEADTGLLFPTGDIPSLVRCIRSIFEDDRLATTLGSNALKKAKNRHNPETIVHDQLTAYKEILLEAN